MPRVSGIYTLPVGNPVTTGTTITSNWANTTLTDIATTLTTSVATDGQTPMTGNLPMGSNKITGLANGTDANDAVNYGQLHALVPTGCIMMWSGSIGTIPSGWLLCDGTAGTPNLVNRFIVGAGSTYGVGSTGGSADAIVVSHNHTATATSVVTDPGHSHGVAIYTAGGPGADTNTIVALGSGIAYATSVVGTGVTVATSATVNSSGASGTNANLPPYYALAYIMKS